MNCADAIRQRRSVRKYSSREIPEKDIIAMIDAGIWAPSGLNNQPWKFKIISDKGTKASIEKFTKYSHIIKSAEVLICVFLDKKQIYNRDKDLMAVGACIQNMLLKAYSLGIGTCWLGEILNQKEALCAHLNIEDDLELAAVISLGYPAEKKESGQRKKISEFVLE